MKCLQAFTLLLRVHTPLPLAHIPSLIAVAMPMTTRWSVLRPTARDSVSIQTTYSQSDYPDQIQQECGQQAQLSDRHHSIEYNHKDRRWNRRPNFSSI